MGPELNRVVLSSGAILIHERRALPVTSVAIACKVGSIYENRKIKGISHFTEHLVFKGTKQRSQQEITKAIESAGGNLNAFTSYDITAFHAKVPSRHFFTALDVLADMVQNPLFPEAEIEKEKAVILEEIKMIHDDPKRFLFDKVFECLYGGDAGLPIIGTKQSVASLNKPKLLDWHNTFYSAQNFIIAVVGNNSFDEVKKACEEKILEQKLQTKAKARMMARAVEIKEIVKNFVQRRQNLEQAHLGFSFHVPNGFSKYRYSCELIDAILGYGMSSWLFQEIREKRALAYSVKSELEIGTKYGHLTIYAGTDKSKVKEVENIVVELIKKLKSIDTKELDEAKEELIGNYDIRRENSLLTCFELLFYELVGKLDEYYKYSEKISAVKQAEIAEIIERVKAQGLSKVFILPK